MAPPAILALMVTKIGGAALSAMLGMLCEKLSSEAFFRLGKIFNLEDKLKSLEEKLYKICSLVSHAEMQIVPDPRMAIWLKDLKIVARDAEDVLEDFAAAAQSNYDIGAKIDEIQKRLADIAEEWKVLVLACPPLQLQLEVREWRATSSLQTERSVFGRELEKENLIRLLLGDDSTPLAAFSVLPIVAMGGIGKTTLVRLVYNDNRVRDEFHLTIWVCVSNDFNVTRITEQILAAVSHERPCCCGIASLDKLQNDLRRKLKSTRFLLVLDDVWSENPRDWEKLCAPLDLAAAGSKIVITTRSRKVADIIGTMDPFFLQPLPYENCWDLFKLCAFANNSGEHPRLEEIGKKILKRLNGVPLAVKTIGGLLYSNTDEGAWMTILDCRLWELSRYEDDIMPVLRLSYQHMPAHLKLCFQFCSIFPKGYRFDKHRLVLLWMAQGFILPQGKRRVEDMGGEYFDELVCRSFFHKADDDYFLMYDLMHDLAQSVSSDECAIIDDQNLRIPQKVIHASLHVDNSFEFKDLYMHKGLRTLLFLEKNFGYNFSRVPKEMFVELKYMRALDLSHSHIEELPNSISFLKHLRYLDLSYSKIKSLPKEVGELINLQTMQLINCSVTTLPSSMNKLTNLSNFKGKANLLSKVAGIGNLKRLQELQKYEISRENGRKAGELKALTELRGGLHISKLENVMSKEEADEALLNEKQYLHTVELEWSDSGKSTREGGADKQVLESLKPHANLKTLKIRCNDGIDFPSWLTHDHLPNLENVSVDKCQRWSVLPPFGRLASLKYLEIREMTSVTNLQPEFWGDNRSSSLLELKIFGMAVLASLGVDRILSLQKLVIDGCPQLTILPALPPTLKELSLLQVGLTALPQLWGCDGGASSSSLSSMLISSCSELITLQQGLLQHHHGALTALKTLKISDCNNLVFLPTEGFSQLTSLTNLVIDNCPNLNPLPDGHSLPVTLETLKVISYTHFFTSNQSLLNQLRNLTSLSTLSIFTIPNLISLSEEVLSCLTALQKLTISGCEELQTLDIKALAALINLVVTRCPNLTSLAGNNAWQENNPLTSITIRECAHLPSLPTNLEELSHLEELTVKSCPLIASRPSVRANVKLTTDIPLPLAED